MRDRNFYRGDYKKYMEHRQKNRKYFGIGIVIVGIFLMLHTMGLLPYFSLQDSWPLILIAVGILIGIKNNFRTNAWWILILVGIINITPQFMIMGKPSTNYIWPAMFIVGGLAMAFRPRRDRCFPRGPMDATVSTASDLNIDVTFGGKKEVVTSKEFKGGIISVTFAGCELNLSQADFTEASVVLDFRVSFGGVEMVVPSHWEIQNEVASSFGSVEDQRTVQTATTNENKKLLILRGTVSFGSIEIKSY